MKKLMMVEEWVADESAPRLVCHHVEEETCYTLFKTKYVPRKVRSARHAPKNLSGIPSSLPWQSLHGPRCVIVQSIPFGLGPEIEFLCVAFF